VIPHAEILALRGEWSLRADVIEKDYVLGWMLAAIAEAPGLTDTWVFKGGTCLRKCFYETYRFSEDLDFTVTGNGPETPEDLRPIFEGVREWLLDQAGLEIVLDETSFLRRQNRRGHPTTQARIAYRGPGNPPTLPKLKLDLTSDEVLVLPTERRPILHPYSDADQLHVEVQAYSIVELLAEKTRALAERCRPRDLYDVVSLHRHPELIGDPRPGGRGAGAEVRLRRHLGPGRDHDQRVSLSGRARSGVAEHVGSSATPSARRGCVLAGTRFGL
jgi:predicted nucleotidyltransferase component of viral defense system